MFLGTFWRFCFLATLDFQAVRNNFFDPKRFKIVSFLRFRESQKLKAPPPSLFPFGCMWDITCVLWIHPIFLSSISWKNDSLQLNCEEEFFSLNMQYNMRLEPLIYICTLSLSVYLVAVYNYYMVSFISTWVSTPVHPRSLAVSVLNETLLDLSRVICNLAMDGYYGVIVCIRGFYLYCIKNWFIMNYEI